MNVCRTCLKTPANKNISQLEEVVNADNKNCNDIMMFCLDITVTPNSNITTNLCYNCYRKIISFYKFKALSIKNDEYLKSLTHYPVTLVDQEISVCVDENGIKLENSLHPDVFGPSFIEDRYKCVEEKLDVKSEGTEDRESHKELQSLEKENETGEIKDETKETALVPKKRKRFLKIKPTKGRKICEECGKSVRSLRSHLTAHRLKGEVKMVQCKFCPKLFCTDGGLKRHHRIKHLGLTKECDICHKKYVNLLAHKQRVHNPHAPRFACGSCARGYSSQAALDVHLTIHRKVHSYECDLCHRKYASKTEITHHIRRVHEKIKLHQCHVCPKAFYLKNHFEDHLRIHSTERPFKCDECGKCFATKSSIRVHRLIHGAPRTVQCQLCEKTYSSKNSLRKHILSHTKERKWACQFCGALFVRGPHRRRHERRCPRRPARPSVAGLAHDHQYGIDPENPSYLIVGVTD